MPNYPILHVLLVGIASPIIGYAVSGPSALAHGWQIPAYALQLCVIGTIAVTTFNRRRMYAEVSRTT
jgi:hypothetical protein